MTADELKKATQRPALTTGTIKAVFENKIPKHGADKHREGSRRMLFAQCVCFAENKGLGDSFAVKRSIEEKPVSVQGEGGKVEWINMVLTAEFTPLS